MGGGEKEAFVDGVLNAKVLASQETGYTEDNLLEALNLCFCMLCTK